MTQAITERTGCTFQIKDHADGTFWITLSTYQPGLPTLGEGFIGFDFKEKMTMTDADNFVQLLRETIGEVSITKFQR